MQLAVAPDPAGNVQAVPLNVPGPLVVNMTVPVGGPALASEAVTVAVQSAASPTVTGDGLHDTAVLVVSRLIAMVV